MSGKKDDLVVREESDSGGYSSPTKEEQVDEVIVRQESGSGEGIVEVSRSRPQQARRFD